MLTPDHLQALQAQKKPPVCMAHHEWQLRSAALDGRSCAIVGCASVCEASGLEADHMRHVAAVLRLRGFEVQMPSEIRLAAIEAAWESTAADHAQAPKFVVHWLPMEEGTWRPEPAPLTRREKLQRLRVAASDLDARIIVGWGPIPESVLAPFRMLSIDEGPLRGEALVQKMFDVENERWGRARDFDPLPELVCTGARFSDPHRRTIHDQPPWKPNNVIWSSVADKIHTARMEQNKRDASRKGGG